MAKMDKNSEEYKLATKAAMFLADRLNAVGIKTVVVNQEGAREAVKREQGTAELSMRDIMRLSYTWDGEEISMRGFAEQFQERIKQKDRTMEDAERIAKEFIEAVKADPEAAGMKMLKPEIKVDADRVNNDRKKDIRSLIQYFEGNQNLTWTEKALIVKGAMSFGYSEKKDKDNKIKTEIKPIEYNNSIRVPVLGGEAMRIVEGLRNGMNFKQALLLAREKLSQNIKRSVPHDFTGWKIYKQSDKEEDIIILNDDVYGTGWCIAGEGYGRHFLSNGDIHVYFESGEPLIGIATEEGIMSEPPRGAHEEQRCTIREEQIAFEYIKAGNGIIAGGDYVDDLICERKLLSSDATWKDAFMFPAERHYANGHHDGNQEWGQVIQSRLDELLNQVSIEQRHAEGYYFASEVDSFNIDNVRFLKGNFDIPNDKQFIFRNLKEISGDIIVGKNSILKTPILQTVEGNIEVNNNGLIDSPILNSVRKCIHIEENGTFDVPGLKSVNWQVQVEKNGTLNAISLEYIGSDFVALGTVDVSSLNTVGGSFTVGKYVIVEASSLKFVKDSVNILDSGIFSAPVLEFIGNSIEVENNGKIDIPALEFFDSIISIGSNGVVNASALKSVRSIHIYANGVFKSPVLDTVEYISIDNNGSLDAPVLKRINKDFKIEDSIFNAYELDFIGKYIISGNAVINAPKLTKVEEEGYLSKDSIINAPLLQKEDEFRQEFRLSDGTIYGYQVGDTIYLTPEGINPNTPIHEYAHLWAKAYKQLEPEKWEALKGELKTLPLWNVIENSEAYSFIGNDEDRLAGEVLATVVGDKGEILMSSAASKTLLEGVPDKQSVIRTVEHFRQMVTGMALNEVFEAEGMEITSDVTLKVLQDYAEGKGVKISQVEGERLAAMAYSGKRNEGASILERQTGEEPKTVSSKYKFGPEPVVSSIETMYIEYGREPSYIQRISSWKNYSAIVPEGTRDIFNVDLWEQSFMNVPEGVKRIGMLGLHDGSFVKLNDDLEKLEEVYLDGATTVDIPKGVKDIKVLSLCGYSYAVISENVEHISNVYMEEHSSIIFPDGFVLKAPAKLSGEEMDELLAQHRKTETVEKDNVNEESQSERKVEKSELDAEYDKKFEIQPDRKPERKTKAREIYDRLCQTGEGMSKGKKI